MRVVIVGAGPAGLTAAEQLRTADPHVRIWMLSAEPHPPYSPPALADHFLTGRNDTLFWKGRDVCERLAIDFRPGVAVRRLDSRNRRVYLEDGNSVLFDRLLIASGSRPHAPIAGNELSGITNFKSLSAASALVRRARQRRVERAVVVGGGFIGVEVALLLADLGVSVTLLEAREHVMPAMLDLDTARMVERELRRRGVELRLETKVRSFLGSRVVDGVEPESGPALGGDVFVAATGVRPNIEWLEGSGVDMGWGVRVDDSLRTNVEHVYAAGDVAETRDRITGKRWVHAIFPNAVEQGRVVGLALAGHESTYAGAESMNSLKHVGLPVIAVGEVRGDDELTYRAGNTLRKVFLSRGRIVGFRLAGDVRAAGVYRSLMLRRADVRALGGQLVEPSFCFAATLASSSQLAH